MRSLFNKALLATVLATSVFSLSLDRANAATATTNMNVTLSITAGCQVSASNLAFGTSSGLFSAINSTANITTTCTNTTPYSIGLSAGNGTGATVTNRLMTGPSAATVQYSLYRDSGRTLNWGVTSGTDTVQATGTGASQSTVVYGLVPTQNSPAPGSYSDVVQVTVTY